MKSRGTSRRTVIKAAGAAPLLAMLPVSMRMTGAQETVVATMITDTAGLGDQNFNDLANAGGLLAAEEFGAEWRVIESIDAAAYVPNLTAGAEQGDLTVAVGFLLIQALEQVASQYPDDNFTLIDAEVDLPNVQSVLFREQEAAYLVGIAAGLTTSTNKVGVVGGQRIPPVIRYEVGFKAGVESVNPECEVVVAYVDSFQDPDRGKEVALAQFNDGADIVFPVAGLTGVGCYEAVRELNQPGVQWVLGADVSQDQLAPGFELCVARKGVDFASYRAVEQQMTGTFEPGVSVLGIAEGGVGFEDPNERVPGETLAIVSAYEALIVAGSLVPPSTDEEYEAFVAPEMPGAAATPEATPAG